MTNANPSINPADLESLTGAFKHIFNKLMLNMDGVLPATVLGYEPGPPAYVSVQPQINVLATNGSSYPRAQISRIPVIQSGGGGYVINYPLNPGDKGWIVACDRDISGYLQTGQSSSPNTLRKKNFADSIFIPDIGIQYVRNPADLTNLVIQSASGDVRISLSQNSITLTAPNTVIDSDLAINGDVESTGAFKITGDLRVVGNITASGNITPNIP